MNNDLDAVLGLERRGTYKWVRLAASALAIAEALLLATLMATETKSWWRWCWDSVASGFTDTSRDVVHWPLFLLVFGIAAAWLFATRGGR